MMTRNFETLTIFHHHHHQQAAAAASIIHSTHESSNSGRRIEKLIKFPLSRYIIQRQHSCMCGNDCLYANTHTSSSVLKTGSGEEDELGLFAHAYVNTLPHALARRHEHDNFFHSTTKTAAAATKESNGGMVWE
jgi:hypothetical protein